MDQSLSKIRARGQQTMDKSLLRIRPEASKREARNYKRG
jgi:hypothetical protein